MAYPSQQSKNVYGVISGGIIAGIIAGLVMAAFSMMYAAMVGVGFFTPLRLIAAALAGVTALIDGGGILTLGVAIHMMASAVFGIIFAALLPRRTSGGAAFGLGLVYGVVVWAVMTFIGLPAVNPVMGARVALMRGSWFFEHLLFGAVLAITPALVRRFSHVPEVTSMPQRRMA